MSATRKEEKNGVIRPHANTLAGEAWALFDELGHRVTVRHAVEVGDARGLNERNIRTELCHWRKYHGIKM